MARKTNPFRAIGMLLLASATSIAAASSCDTSTLDNSTYLYNITEYGTTIFDVANATGRGVCDIGRYNIMADVEIIPNVGQGIVIPPQVCEPDNESCILPRQNATRDCIYGGPRLYYTVNGDTYERIALYRLNITVESLMGSTNTTGATDVLEAGQFIKVPECYPSRCVIEPYQFTYGVYKDLAEKYDSTVGQIMMLSETYNYSQYKYNGDTPPSIALPINCTALSNNITVLS